MNNHLVRAIVVSARAVTTFAGRQGVALYSDGIGTSATFTFPSGVALNSAGTVAVVVSGCNEVVGRKGREHTTSSSSVLSLLESRC
jgi:hypothetical protein